MTDGRNREMTLKVTFSLLLFSLLEQGVHGQCSTPPKNQAYYEGTANTMMTCNGPIPVSWLVTPTNDELMSRKITNFSDTVLAPFTNIYDVTQTNLNIRIDQSTAVLPNLTTSGLYVAQNTTSGSNNKVGAKLVVVRGPPTCNCTAINSTSNNITCSITYADYGFNPIYPKVTWTADGAFYSSTVLNGRTRVNNACTSTSTITTSVNDPRVYQCNVTFAKPSNIAIAYIATNAPAFSALCTAPCVYDQCSTPLINQVVYEGTQNTMMSCNSSAKVSWLVYPTNDDLFSRKITNFSDTVLAPFTNIYDVTQTNLNIRIDQSTAVLPYIATSGLYVAQYSPSGSYNKVGAKLVVVRGPPTCNCTAINSTNNNITCSVTYADASYNPIYAKMTWTADGAFYSSSILNGRTRVNYAFTSTSTITTSVNDPRVYQCNVTFAKPSNISIEYVATNAPDFTASCTAPCPLCLPNLKNIAVYEGQLNTLMNLATDFQNVSWTVLPTSDESTTYDIMDVGGSNQFPALYDVTQTGLIIKKATTTENGNAIATAGLYIGQCADNTNKTGAKLLVVHTGPQCSCISIDSTASNVSCNVTYADCSLHPIRPIVTWKLNGAYLASYTLPRKRIGAYVFYAESSTRTNSGAPENYTCELTFSAPADIQYPYVATNAPDFNATCTGCGR